MGVNSYKDLTVWQKSLGFVERIYKSTNSFPRDELYGLVSQMRRAAVSIPSNIAEGSCKRSTKEYIRFINIASGSVAELETQIIIANKLGFIGSDELEHLTSSADEIGKMLYGLQNALSNKAA